MSRDRCLVLPNALPTFSSNLESHLHREDHTVDTTEFTPFCEGSSQIFTPMAYVAHIDLFASRLLDESADFTAKHSVLSELCETLESYHGSQENEYLLGKMIPALMSQLDLTPVSFLSNSPEQKLRHLVLEIIHRMPTNETFQPFAETVLDKLTECLNEENEDNGVQCMKIITSLHKAFKSNLFEKVQPFVDFINQIYVNIPEVVQEQFGSGDSVVEDDSELLSPSGEIDDQTSHQLAKATHSFKTLAECPITMVSLYSSYKELFDTSLPAYIPHVIDVLTLQAPKQAEAHAEAQAKGEYLISISPAIKNKDAYGDFILGQVKAASFLAYIFIRRNTQTVLKQYYSQIPDLIIRLLQDCPSKLSAARKELLHATRHILSTAFRDMFISKIDMFFDERVLIGDGLTAHETLRPLAYSTVADFVHNVRSKLSPPQIWKSVEVYCKNLQDPSLALTVQIMSAKLLLNLVDRIMNLESKFEGRQLFMLIIDAYSKRFKALNRQYENIMYHHKDFESKAHAKLEARKEVIGHNSILPGDENASTQTEKVREVNSSEIKPEDDLMDIDPESSASDQLDTLNFFDIQRSAPIQISPLTQDPYKDSRYLFRTLMTFLKSVMFGLKKCNPPPSKDYNPQTWNESARIFTNEELEILRELYRECVTGLRFFQSSTPTVPSSVMRQSFDISGPSLPITSSKEEKDLMEIFAAMFIPIDPATFNEIVDAEMPAMYEAMLKNAALLHIPQFFLASEVTSSNFSGILIKFLKSKLDELGEVDIIKSNILIRLFKLCFMSVNLFPSANETVILPHLNSLILKSLELTTTAQEPIVYFYLIRTLFRSIGGGRFEALYKEIMPLLQVLLESLNRMIQTARRPQERDIYVELCLTVPVRLSVLVPHLSYLMRPLVYALNGSQELISQGLRTLELCVDNLTAEYFDPIIEPVIEEVMEALWRHLRPLPYYHQHSHTTLRILGKLGGRNRSFISLHKNLEGDTPTNQEIEALFKIEGFREMTPVSISSGITTALSILVDPRYKAHYRVNSFRYLSSILKLFIDSDNIPDDLASRVEESIDVLLSDSKEEEKEKDKYQLKADPVKDIAKFEREEKLLLRLLEALFYSVSIDEVREEAQVLIRGICNHYVLLHFGKNVVEKRKFNRPFSVNSHEGKIALSENTIFDAISYGLSFYIKSVREEAVEAIKIIFNAAVTLFGSVEKAIVFPMVRAMVSKFIHCCFEEAYYNRLGGCIGLKTLLNDLEIPISYFASRQLEISRAMFFVLRDTASDVPSEVCNVAKELVIKILRDCNKELSKAEVFQNSFQGIVSSLVFDLSNANEVVRQTSQLCLQTLSDVTQVPVATMIGPCKSILLAPIFAKPLRALPFQNQIGNIDAITFCLGLDDTFLDFSNELTRLLSEAHALVDAEDESLISAHRIYEHKTSQQLIKLRVVCIKLLSLALIKPDFSKSGPQIRIRVLSVFFKALCSKSTEIINAAYDGLKAVLAQNNKLPKDLLQNGLRPMLMNLSDHKKLAVSGLKALSSLLELLISYFKVEIGRKLLDHLNAWAQPATLHQIANQELENNPTVQIIVAILNIFYLLPPKAYTFMDEIMKTLLYLEDNLHRRQSSPFRAPIAKFLNRFSEQAIQFFISKFSSTSSSTRFVYFVALPECEALLEQAKTNLPALMQSITQETKSEIKCTKFANMIGLVNSISSRDSDWFKDQKPLMAELLTIAEQCLRFERAAPLMSPIRFQVTQSVEKLQLLHVSFFRLCGSGSDEVLPFINKICTLDTPLSSALEDYIFDDIVKSADAEKRKNYLLESVKYATTGEFSLKTQIFLFKHIFNAICIYEGLTTGNLYSLEEGDGSASWLDSLREKIWLTEDQSITNHTSGSIDSYRFELMQATALVIKYSPDRIAENKKDVIKFTWNFIKLDDSITKQAAYVATSYFIAAFSTPPEIVTPVFTALLKTHHVDTKYLVRQALDLLAPVLSERMEPTGSSMTWLKWPRRVLLEDGFNVTQVVNVYQFIVQHSDLFFVARDDFIPNIITAIGKLTVLTNTATENQVLAIDMAELILVWETKARKLRNESGEVQEVKEDADGDQDMDSGATPSVTSAQYTVPFGQRETCITFLIRYICISQQRASENELGQRALRLLYELLGPDYWSEVTVKLSFFERFLVTADFNTSNVLGYCLNALEVLGVALEWKQSEWIVSNLGYLQKLLEKCLRSANHDIQEVLQRVLRIILKALNDESPDSEEKQNEEVKSFLALLVSIVSEDLNNMNSVAAGVTLSWTLANYKPEVLDSLVPLIMRTLSKLVKDHISITIQGRQSQASESAASSHTSTADEAKMTTKLLEKILNLSAMRIATLGDQRRIFLSLLAQLIDRSADKDLLQRIIEIARSWVFSKTDLFPTTKEKAGILGKMMVFDLKGDPTLSKDFYQIIVDIFKDETLEFSELTVRMEQPFLVGTKLAEVEIRESLMSILDSSLEKDISKRLYYVIREQNWEYLAEYPWLNQALQLLYGSFDLEKQLKFAPGEYQLQSLGNITETLPDVSPIEKPKQSIQDFVSAHEEFMKTHLKVIAGDIIRPLVDISYQSPEAIHNAWLSVFPVAYKSIDRRDQTDFMASLVTLLSKDYHVRQQDSRPNVIKSMLGAVARCDELQLPPHLVKYLASNYDAWYNGIKILEQIESGSIDNQKIKEANRDALAEVYSSLQEDDMFYGLWRRRAKYFETNVALSYEQLGLWDKALQLYETAQIKARSGILPYSESEYALWEDNWILCAEKLQHWDILTELAKHEGFTDLLLECGWRVADWMADREPLEQSVKAVMDVPTPRRQMFQTFLCLQGYAHHKESIQDVTRYCDEGIQLALRKWHGLPERVTNSHVSLLHIFQQYVEFMEASQVYSSLVTTNAQNLDVRSQELKRVLQAWRERLPNVWDDINLWNDLVTWRQHAFAVINKAYMPFIPTLQQSNGNSGGNSYAYRGYHEIAWVINRFAHVARKHNMPEVCINQLTKIYTLPNIEIQEAFLKLREQAKCHYQNPNELNTGLDVISNTNLVYFATQQKAEFITLKGMFLAKLNAVEEANQAFATAVQIDLNLPKAWAEWGFFNDKRFKENPNDLSYAKNAISCYLQAAGLYKNRKTRRLLCRILWLISLDDASGSLAEAFDSHRGEIPVWHWVTFIPQLLTSLSHKEARLVRQVLIRIAKMYPQALNFQLRTTKEDFAVLQRQTQQASQNQSQSAQTQTQTQSAGQGSADSAQQSSPANTASTANTAGNNVPGNVNSNQSPPASASPQANSQGQFSVNNRQPWEHVEEIMGILKTAYPLLALSLESLVDQLSQRFKCDADEDAYRLVVALYNDGVQYLNRLGNPKEDARLPPSTEANIIRFADSVLPEHILPEFEADVIASKPNLETYISKLRKWRDCLEERLDRAFGKINLERVSPHLSQFHHQKFEDIEVPGQYLLNKDTNSHFIKIERFMPTLDLIRGPIACYKRMTIRGHDGSLHPFAVQFPAARHCRREERIFQLFRIFNDALSRKVQSRRRNIQLTLPIAVPLSPHIRIMTDDSRYINMLAVYEDYCCRKNQNKDEPFAYTIQKLRAAFDPRLPKPDLTSVKTEILGAIQSMLVPSTVLKDYFTGNFQNFQDFWIFRKQFSSQYASFIFMTYMLCINSRQPQKIHINQGSGTIWTSEMLPCKFASGRTHSTAYANSSLDVSAQRASPLFFNNESVPFRLTPNVQKMIGDSGLEGILSTYIMVIAQCLSGQEFDMEQYLSLFVRDEIISWFAQQHRPNAQDPQLREIVRVNVESVVRRVSQLGQMGNGQNIASQHVLNLISLAVNPRNLATTDTLWMAYF
ncbi:unnamed protein product [Kuraishia capsulata CBS 1993]|uniref:Non-specific serine/threonine protein kinase n=1 Tax=Kuraishia capsulata CBS 1993 TaxID=1382522 RepID=W6MGD9_9ASCO|nr:uncharacterized protein KUCA_T00000823001 [Kuraishia capsulata CBS 1993]CDK24856.1 unnamed protein product [Kuraishia capsulata CBS 1993]